MIPEHRLRLLERLLTLGFLAVAGRVGYLSIWKSGPLFQRAEQNRLETFHRRAWRGAILARDNSPLAESEPRFIAFAPLAASAGDPSAEEIRRLLEEMGGVALRWDGRQAWMLRRPAALRLATSVSGPPVRLETGFVRRYPLGAAAGHLTGYLGFPPGGDEKIGLPWEPVGRDGLEASLQPILRGRSGWISLEVDSRGRRSERPWMEQEPQPGMSIRTSIDPEIQRAAHAAMAGLRGAAVVLNPRSGEVLALLSSPGFDPAAFQRDPLGRARSPAAYLEDREGRPLWNRAIHGRYPVASTFKLVVALALLEKGLDPEEPVNCRGSFLLGDPPRAFRCWLASGHGPVNLTRALIHSCDVYFYQRGLELGPKVLADYARQMGLEEPTGLDLPSETGGLVPDPEWKRSRLRQNWYDGDTVNLSVGQGFLLATPAQMARMYAGISMAGAFPRLRLAWERLDPEGKRIRAEAPEVSRRPIQPNHLKILRRALVEAVRIGTGRAAALPGVSVAGKTGTAQALGGPDHAWFCAWAPAENPEVALAVLVEHGGSGGKAAAPIAGKILAAALRRPAASPEVPEITE